MNTFNPPGQFQTQSELVDGFIDLLTEIDDNPYGLHGAVRITIQDCPLLSFTVIYGDRIRIVRGPVKPDCDTEISLPIATIETIFEDSEFLDWRDPEVIGTISLSGDHVLANHLAKSCPRPTDRTVQRYRMAAAFHAERGYKNLEEVIRLSNPSQIEVLEAMETQKPIIVSDISDLPDSTNWTLQRLEETYPDVIVRVRSATERQTMSEFASELRRFIDDPGSKIIEGHQKPYTEGAPLSEVMQSDFGPIFFDPTDFDEPQLWLGAVPTHVPATSLHRDPQTGFLFQVIGRKRLDLYSADQAPLLYPMRAHNNYQPCWFRPEKKDFDRFPKARQARCLSVTLNPGQLFIQPAGWFHQVHALDSPNMSVSYFWRD